MVGGAAPGERVPLWEGSQEGRYHHRGSSGERRLSSAALRKRRGHRWGISLLDDRILDSLLVSGRELSVLLTDGRHNGIERRREQVPIKEDADVTQC